MSLSKDEAAEALGEIEAAKGRAGRLRNYRYGAPHAMIWGAVWLVANLTTHFDFRLSGLVWSSGIVLGIVGSAVTGVWQGQDRSRMTEAEREKWARIGTKAMLSNGLTVGFLIAFFSILAPFDVREYNAGISLIAMFGYALMGVWLGWRLLVIGAMGAAVILFAYFNIREGFELWMGLGAGGALFLGGLWLWKA